MFCQGASGRWGPERGENLKLPLVRLLDGSWASPGAPSCALGPLWACLACRPVLFGRLLDALGRPTWPLNCQTAVQKPCQVAQSACQASLQACRTLTKTVKNAVLSSNFEVRAVLHSKRSWTPLGGLLGANLDVLGVHLAASVTNLRPTWTLLGST